MVEKNTLFSDEKVLEKYETSTDPSFGKNPLNRSIEEHFSWGFLIVMDKPRKINSHQFAELVKNVISAEKVGHPGTLDPNATGILPILINRGVKVEYFMQKSWKEYVGVMYLHKDVDLDKIIEVKKKFEGVIEQIPPVRSAVKRSKRKRRIYYIDIIEKSGRLVLFKTKVESGTYIRKLVHDIGEKLGVGAHLCALRRIGFAHITEDDCVNFYELQVSFHKYKEEGDPSSFLKTIKPIEYSIKFMKKVWLNDFAVGSFTYGSPIYSKGIVKFSENLRKGDVVAVLSLKDELVGFGSVTLSPKEILNSNLKLALKPVKVYMKRGIYPRKPSN